MEVSGLDEEEDGGNRMSSVLERFSLRYQGDLTAESADKHSLVFLGPQERCPGRMYIVGFQHKDGAKNQSRQ